jgi:hypothetical protein
MSEHRLGSASVWQHHCHQGICVVKVQRKGLRGWGSRLLQAPRLHGGAACCSHEEQSRRQLAYIQAMQAKLRMDGPAVLNA